MKRIVIWSIVAVVVLATLGTVGFLHYFEQVPTSHWEAAQKEARRNPYLALEHLFGKLGRPATRLESPRALNTLPAGGVLILDGNRRRYVDKARTERLLDWVKRGGYLIVAGENSGDDPLLARLGLSRYRPPSTQQCTPGKNEEIADDEDTESADVAEATEETAPPPPKADLAKSSAPLEIRLPDSDIAYRFGLPANGLTSSTLTPAWQAGFADDRSTLLHYAWGRGQITVVEGLLFLGNGQINKHDHAELIWALLQRYQPQGPIYLASRLEVPTLWQWLAESAWMALISTTLLIALWLWQLIPRFGGTLATPSGERRELAQHLAAIGRSVWREGGIAHWLAVVRQALHKRLSLHHPYLYRQEASDQRIALAKIAACKTKDIWSALTPGQAETPHKFTEAMQILQRLDQRL